MAALTADRPRHVRGVPVSGSPMGVAASTKIYAGAILCNNTSGYAVPAADTASYLVVGIAPEQVDNSSGSAGDKNITPEAGHVERLAISGSELDITDIGKNAIVVDDQTVGDATAQTNDVAVGVILGIDGSYAWVWIGVIGPTNA